MTRRGEESRGPFRRKNDVSPNGNLVSFSYVGCLLVTEITRDVSRRFILLRASQSLANSKLRVLRKLQLFEKMKEETCRASCA